MTLRTLIADDEPLARELLASWVRIHPDLHLVGQAEDGSEVLQQLQRLKVDLLFLDIQMPALDGLATLKAIRELGLQTYVILVTAWNQYAVSAFDLAAGDYLVKPVRKDRFADAVERAKHAGLMRESFQKNSAGHDPLWIRQQDSTIPLRPEHIVWVEAAGQYARIHTAGGEFLVSKPLAEVASELPQGCFARIHRSALVSLQNVLRIRHRQGRCSLELSNGAEVPIARSRREEVIERIRQFSGQAHA